jgi:YfiH family protein
MNLGHARGDDLELVKENYRRFCGAIGANVQNLVFSQQIHIDNVRVCTTEDAGKGLYRPRDYEADGLVTDVPGLPLVIFSADCLPVLLYDPVRRVIGACHCGWRGTAMGIARKTVETLCRVYGSRPTDILAAIGPGISQCCFETHRDVPDAIRASLGEAAEETILPLPNDKFRVDLKAVNSIWLQRAGLPLENISVTEQCTCCQPEKFWTHRLVGQARGSMAAIIQLAE